MNATPSIASLPMQSIINEPFNRIFTFAIKSKVPIVTCKFFFLIVNCCPRG